MRIIVKRNFPVSLLAGREVFLLQEPKRTQKEPKQNKNGTDKELK
jgi:hypothetical protein